MKFLVDQNRSPRLAELLNDAGHDAVHTLDVGLEQADDDVVLTLADAENRVVVTGDTTSERCSQSHGLAHHR